MNLSLNLLGVLDLFSCMMRRFDVKQIRAEEEGKERSTVHEIGALALSHLNEQAQVETSLDGNLIFQFYNSLNHLKSISDAGTYSLMLKEAEDILCELGKKAISSHKLSQMKQAYQMSFQNLPDGDSVLMQQDLDYLQKYQAIPLNSVCQNAAGDKFTKPSLSIQALVSHYTSLNYHKVMFSRELENFEGRQEICDVVMVGVGDPSLYVRLFQHLVPSFASEVDEAKKREPDYENEIKRLKAYFVGKEMAQQLGYETFQIKLICYLEDQEKARRLIEQGFQICTILTYPKIK